VLVLRSLPAVQATPAVRQRRKATGGKIFRGENIDGRNARYDILSDKERENAALYAIFFSTSEGKVKR
jgi:hypothetical protein